MVEEGGKMKISLTNPDYFVLNLPIKARRKTRRRCLKNILFWAGVTGVLTVFESQHSPLVDDDTDTT